MEWTEIHGNEYKKIERGRMGQAKRKEKLVKNFMEDVHKGRKMYL